MIGVTTSSVGQRLAAFVVLVGVSATLKPSSSMSETTRANHKVPRYRRPRRAATRHYRQDPAPSCNHGSAANAISDGTPETVNTCSGELLNAANGYAPLPGSGYSTVLAFWVGLADVGSATVYLGRLRAGRTAPRPRRLAG